MATTSYFDPLAALGGIEGSQVVVKKPSFFGRLVDALKESRKRQAEREIRRYAAIHGYDARHPGRGDLPF